MMTINDEDHTTVKIKTEMKTTTITEMKTGDKLMTLMLFHKVDESKRSLSSRAIGVLL